MRCEAVQNKLDRLSRQELAPRMRERVEAHLIACADCRQHLARQEWVVSVLARLPQPPAVPEGFGDRLMAAACERHAGRQSVPVSLWRRRWLRLSPSLGRRAVQAAVLAGSLLVGIVMGQQTWRSTHPWNRQPGSQSDPLAVYELDYLSDSPTGSLTQAYLMLTQAPEQDGV